MNVMSSNNVVYRIWPGTLALTSGTFNAAPDDMPAEVDFSGGERGKYYERVHGFPPDSRPSWKRGIWANG